MSGYKHRRDEEVATDEQPTHLPHRHRHSLEFIAKRQRRNSLNNSTYNSNTPPDDEQQPETEQEVTPLPTSATAASSTAIVPPVPASVKGSSTDASSSPSSATDIHPKALSASPSPLSSASTAESTAKQGFQLFVSTFDSEHNRILHTLIPHKILQIQQMIQTYPAYTHALDLPSASQTITPITTPLSPHPLLSSLIPILQSESTLFLQHISTLKLHIQLNIPSIDDADAFAVEIQEETISELSRMEDLMFSINDRLLSYTHNRSKLASKLIKYPGIIDYYHSIRELDQYQYIDIQLSLIECRNFYQTIHDILIKNQDRLKDPTKDNKQRQQQMAM